MAYTALTAQEGYAVGRVAGGEDEVEAETVVVTDDAVVSEQFVATKEGFAVARVTATDEGVVGGVAVITADEETEESASDEEETA